MKHTLLLKGVSSDHRIVSAMICLSLHRNKTQTVKAAWYDWCSLIYIDNINWYTVIVRNKIDTLQKNSETHTLNNEYENFVTAFKEAAAVCIPSKLRAKCRIPWVNSNLRKMR